jgi:hypothetical protein
MSSNDILPVRFSEPNREVVQSKKWMVNIKNKSCFEGRSEEPNTESSKEKSLKSIDSD